MSLLPFSKRFLAAAAVGATFCGVLVAQIPTDSEAGREAARRVYESVAKIPDGKVAILKYVLSTVTVVDGSPHQSSVEVSCHSGEDLFLWSSDQVSTFQDRDVMVMVSHSDRRIVISKSSPEELRMNQRQTISGIRDSLFDAESTVSYSEAEGDEEGDMILVLAPNAHVRAATMADTISILMNPDLGLLKRVTVSYQDGIDLQEVDAVYQSLEYVDEGEYADRSPLRLIFDSAGQVRSEFAGYSVTDLR